MAGVEYEADLSRVMADLETARDELMSLVDTLQAGDLDKARRGGWSVRAILLGVIESERHYARGVGALRGSTAAVEASRRLLRTPTDATLMLLEDREELLRAIAGVDEETFYRLAPFKTEEGHGQEYSILSLIENVANHEREHAAQIRSLLA